MSRELKFRAWNTIHKEMSNNFTLLDCINQNQAFALPENFEFMQYTGLKDKNGVEVYEGDIVKFVGGTTSILSCGNYRDQVHNIGVVLCVVSLESGFTLCMRPDVTTPNLVGNVDNYQLWNHHGSLEIIGNIYQNPGLLTQ